MSCFTRFALASLFVTAGSTAFAAPAATVSGPAQPQLRAASSARVPLPLVDPAAQATTPPDAAHSVASAVVVTQKGQPRIHFPALSPTTEAVRRFAANSVSHGRNRCATSLREALGWGLGDAHEWVALPKEGFKMRQPGTQAQPGDIVVWPWTFGRRGSQHVGLCVGTEQGNRLLSNLTGSIVLSELVPGYRAYYKEG